MLTCDLFVDMEDSRFPVFMARSTFTYNHTEWSREDLESHFNPLHQSFNALESQLYVPVLEAEKPKVGILFSNMHHCVTELLHRYESKELACIITMAVSNHPSTLMDIYAIFSSDITYDFTTYLLVRIIGAKMRFSMLLPTPTFWS